MLAINLYGEELSEKLMMIMIMMNWTMVHVMTRMQARVMIVIINMLKMIKIMMIMMGMMVQEMIMMILMQIMIMIIEMMR